MIKIKVSYEHPEELERILYQLGKEEWTVKKPRQQASGYKKAYLLLKQKPEKT